MKNLLVKDLLSPLMPPLNEEKDTSRKTENRENNIGNRIGNGVLLGFACSISDPVAFYFPDVLQTNCFVWRRMDTNTSLKRRLIVKEARQNSRKTRIARDVLQRLQKRLVLLLCCLKHQMYENTSDFITSLMMSGEQLQKPEPI